MPSRYAERYGPSALGDPNMKPRASEDSLASSRGMIPGEEHARNRRKKMELSARA